MRKFAQHDEPLARQMDKTGVLPDEVLPLLARQGYLSVRLPESVGGMGMGLMPCCVMLGQAARTAPRPARLRRRRHDADRHRTTAPRQRSKCCPA